MGGGSHAGRRRTRQRERTPEWKRDAKCDEGSGVSPLETVSHPGRLHTVPAASRGGGVSGLGVGTDGRTDGGPKKQNETEAININPHPDGRTDCSHVGQQRGEERGHMSTRRREFCSERRAEERSGGSRSYTELMKPRVWFASIHRFPPEVEHESFVLKMGLLRL